MNSFLQGKKILSISPLRPMATSAPSVAPAAGVTSHAAPPVTSAGSHPTVEVVKEGDKVVRLVVVCSCGERVDIECLYPGGG
jgi:hypothetical protein